MPESDSPSSSGAKLTLLPHHAQMLTASSIAPEVAAARGYRSVTTMAELRRLGFSDFQCRVPALLIPIRNIQGEVVLYQARPDVPRIRDGKPIKYETPSGTRMALDVPPSVRRWLGDPGRSLFITEGVRKADAAVSRDLCCIALLGVWGWRGTNEHGGKIALAEWEQVALNGRLTYICFDSDIMAKPEVHAAMVRLKAFLESRGAKVLLIYLPPGEGGTKVGLDDYFAAGRAIDELLVLASPELRVPPRANNDTEESPYRETPTGLVWGKSTEEGQIPIPLTNFAASIVADVCEDDGAEVRRTFQIEAKLNDRTTHFVISASHFAGMNWVSEHLGAGAIVYPGFGIKDHARAAIQCLSGSVEERRLYTHTGWRKISGVWAYLHAGGAIGPDGALEGVEVRLPDQLAGYVLPNPPTDQQLSDAIWASLSLLKLGPDDVIVPLYSAIWRAAVTTTDFGEHLSGSTGEGKTSLGALIQQHWGAGMNSRNLPASWSSTANSIEALAFAAKDALLMVDDFAPNGTATDVQRIHREADRILRAQGNHTGRMRMRADSTLRPAKPPRGLILSTGEDVPRGESLRARLLVLELSPGALDWERLTTCQCDAETGLYAQALAGFVRWLASGYEQKRQALLAEVVKLRQGAVRSSDHRRTPEIIANLGAGFQCFLSFAQEAGALTPDDAKVLWERCWLALGKVASAQAQHRASAEPTRRFVDLLSAAIASGRAHAARLDGKEPEVPAAWGWRLATVGGGNARDEWRPNGDRVGWVDGSELYLEPDAAYAVVQRFGRDGGEGLAVSLSTLKRRMRDRGMLMTTDEKREVLTVRRTLEGKRRDVLHLHKDILAPSPSQKPDQPDQADEKSSFDPVPKASWSKPGRISGNNLSGVVHEEKEGYDNLVGLGESTKETKEETPQPAEAVSTRKNKRQRPFWE